MALDGMAFFFCVARCSLFAWCWRVFSFSCRSERNSEKRLGFGHGGTVAVLWVYEQLVFHRQLMTLVVTRKFMV